MNACRSYGVWLSTQRINRKTLSALEATGFPAVWFIEDAGGKKERPRPMVLQQIAHRRGTLMKLDVSRAEGDEGKGNNR